MRKASTILTTRRHRPTYVQNHHVNNTKAMIVIDDAGDTLRQAEAAWRSWRTADRWEGDERFETWLEERQQASRSCRRRGSTRRSRRGSAPQDDFEPDDGEGFDRALRAAIKVAGLIRAETDVEAIESSIGRCLSMHSMHAWVSSAAASFLADGHQPRQSMPPQRKLIFASEGKLGHEQTCPAPGSYVRPLPGCPAAEQSTPALQGVQSGEANGSRASTTSPQRSRRANAGLPHR